MNHSDKGKKIHKYVYNTNRKYPLSWSLIATTMIYIHINLHEVFDWYILPVYRYRGI